MKNKILQSVVETPEFMRQAENCMDQVSKENLTMQEKKTLHKLIKQIVESYRGKNE